MRVSSFRGFSRWVRHHRALHDRRTIRGLLIAMVRLRPGFQGDNLKRHLHGKGLSWPLATLLPNRPLASPRRLPADAEAVPARAAARPPVCPRPRWLQTFHAGVLFRLWSSLSAASRAYHVAYICLLAAAVAWQRRHRAWAAWRDWVGAAVRLHEYTSPVFLAVWAQLLQVHGPARRGRCGRRCIVPCRPKVRSGQLWAGTLQY